MATPFKLKSGNASAFKNLGSSPAKQIKTGRVGKINSNSWLTEHGKKLVKDAQTKTPKDFNVKGSAGSTTPGYSTTKAAKGFGGKGYSNPQKGLHVQDYPKGTEGRHSEMLRKTTKQPSKVSKFIKGAKKVGKKALKVGGRVAGVLGVAQLAYGAYKSGQKHSGGKVGSKETQAKWKAQKAKAPKSDIWGKNKKSTNSNTNKGFNFNKGKKK